MAKGFSYIPVQTNRYSSPVIRRLNMGDCMGIAVYDYIISGIFRDGIGGVLQWDESRVLDAAAYFGLKESRVCEIVTLCGAVGLFDKGLLSRGVVTSADIQHLYADMCRRAKRQVPVIPDEYRLIPQENPPKKVREELPKLTEVSPKVREVLPKTPKKLDKVYKNIHTSIDDVYIDTATIGLKEVGDWIDTCLGDTMWTDSVRMKHRKQGGETMSIDELTSLLHSFSQHCICTGAERKTLRDFKQHFTFWLDKQPKQAVKQSAIPRPTVTPPPLSAEEEAHRREVVAKTLEEIKRKHQKTNE